MRIGGAAQAQPEQAGMPEAFYVGRVVNLRPIVNVPMMRIGQLAPLPV